MKRLDRALLLTRRVRARAVAAVRSAVFVPSIVAVVVMPFACSSQGPSAASCPNDLPAACAATPPSYARDVGPVVIAKCAVCHGPGGVEANRDLSTYASVHALRSSVLNQVHACAMPPAGAEALTDAERASLLGWLVCGAPQN